MISVLNIQINIQHKWKWNRWHINNSWFNAIIIDDHLAMRRFDICIYILILYALIISHLMKMFSSKMKWYDLYSTLIDWFTWISTSILKTEKKHVKNKQIEQMAFESSHLLCQLTKIYFHLQQIAKMINLIVITIAHGISKIELTSKLQRIISQ